MVQLAQCRPSGSFAVEPGGVQVGGRVEPSSPRAIGARWPRFGPVQQRLDGGEYENSEQLDLLIGAKIIDLASRRRSAG